MGFDVYNRLKRRGDGEKSSEQVSRQELQENLNLRYLTWELLVRKTCVIARVYDVCIIEGYAVDYSVVHTYPWTSMPFVSVYSFAFQLNSCPYVLCRPTFLEDNTTNNHFLL